MKTLITLLLLTSFSSFAGDYNSETCQFVDYDKNFKVETILKTFNGDLDAEKLTVKQLLALSSYINASKALGHGPVKTVGDALEMADQKEVYILKLTDEKKKKSFYFFDVYSGDNAAGYFSTLNGKKIVAHNSDGDIYCE